MKKYRLYEDKLPSKLVVILSPKITKEIDTIHKLNQDKIENLYQWYSYIDEVQNYISNCVIAWDYNSRHIRFPNGAFFIKDFDYNVGYTIKNNAQNQTYVYVFMMNLKTEEFGLKVPNVNEGRITITRKDLKNIINECVDRCLRKYLKENTIMFNESYSKQQKEQMLVDLYNYLSQEPTDDIYDNSIHGNGYLNTTYKAYNYFEPKSIVHNVWAIHYTNLEAYEDIQKRGFRIGVSDNDALAYSYTYYNNEPPRKSGWNFALPIDNKYLGEDLGYGDCGFIIKTDWVRAYHKGDHDDEIIFKDCMVKKKYPFVYDEDYDCWILSEFGLTSDDVPRGAYYDEELKQVVFEDVNSLVQYVISK